MTLFYHEEANSIIENHPEDWIEFDDDGRLVIDFDEAPREEKVRALLSAAADAVKGSDAYALASEPAVERTGD